MEWTRALVRETQLRMGLHGYETAVRFLRDEPWPKGLLSRTALELYYAQALVTYFHAYSWEIQKRERVETSGAVDLKASRKAATAMVNGYGIAFQPALKSRHVEGRAIDMTISWTGKLSIKTKSGVVTTVSSTPRNGFNADLRRVGKTFGVTKHPTDPPHWSTDGR